MWPRNITVNKSEKFSDCNNVIKNSKVLKFSSIALKKEKKLYDK